MHSWKLSHHTSVLQFVCEPSRHADRPQVRRALLRAFPDLRSRRLFFRRLAGAHPRARLPDRGLRDRSWIRASASYFGQLACALGAVGSRGHRLARPVSAVGRRSNHRRVDMGNLGVWTLAVVGGAALLFRERFPGVLWTVVLWTLPIGVVMAVNAAVAADG